MREVDLVRRIAQLAEGRRKSEYLIKGIGDDCAVLRPPPGSDLVFTTDFVLEGRHFHCDTHSAADVGHKALARSLSDLAAMGSKPLFCLVSLALPESRTEKWTEEFYQGLLALADKLGVALAGGDLSQFDKVVVDVMCCGSVAAGKAILRSGARPGDGIYVTGVLGAAAHSNWRLRANPRIPEGLGLRHIASAGMDISDGLSIDLQRLCEASGVSAELRAETIPIAEGASLEQALHGGEDYELLVTAPPGSSLPLYLTQIGVIASGTPGRVLLDGEPLQVAGFDHFNR